MAVIQCGVVGQLEQKDGWSLYSVTKDKSFVYRLKDGVFEFSPVRLEEAGRIFDIFTTDEKIYALIDESNFGYDSLNMEAILMFIEDKTLPLLYGVEVVHRKFKVETYLGQVNKVTV